MMSLAVGHSGASWRWLRYLGGLGPEGAKTLHRCLKRAAGWLEGDLRAARQEELRLGLGLTLMRQVWQMLEAKNFLG